MQFSRIFEHAGVTFITYYVTLSGEYTDIGTAKPQCLGIKLLQTTTTLEDEICQNSYFYVYNNLSY